MIYAVCVHERAWVLIAAYQNDGGDPNDLYLKAAAHSGRTIVSNGWPNHALMTLLLVEKDDLTEMPDDLAETFRTLIANADLKRSPRPWLN